MEAKNPRGYLEQSRDPTNALILVAPLLVLYQIGLILTGFQGLNGVDFMTVAILHYAGVKGLVVLNLAILLGLAIAAYVRRKKRSLRPEVLGIILVESAFYAFSIGIVINMIMRQLPLGPPQEMGALSGTIASLGAGVNEELFFRLGLLTAIAWTLEDKAGSNRAAAVTVAAVASSLVFSAIHFVGPKGPTLDAPSFLYLFLAGMILSGLFLARGLAVAVYTHALYDIWVIVVLPALAPK